MSRNMQKKNVIADMNAADMFGSVASVEQALQTLRKQNGKSQFEQIHFSEIDRRAWKGGRSHAYPMDGYEGIIEIRFQAVADRPLDVFRYRLRNITDAECTFHSRAGRKVKLGLTKRDIEIKRELTA
jgi:hypothetical protein